MLFRQFVLTALGHASYLIGDERTGQALVLDPRRDVEGYLAAARADGLRITHVLDSHGHNDYLSGLSELAARTGARVLGGAWADLGYAHRAVADNEVLELGDLGFEVRHTPGHTPEHLSLVVHDRAVGPQPALLLSGGALLVGDVARPDLLGDEEHTRSAIDDFRRTLQKRVLDLPDSVEVFPTHVAGSLCGGNIGSRLSTTIGYERATNPLLAGMSGSDGSDDLRFDHLPAVPPYWRRMRTQNLAGVPRLGVLGEPPALRPEAFAEQAAAAVVLDCRSSEAFAGGHPAGSLNVGLGPSFPTWAGTVLDPDADVLRVLDEPADLPEVTWHLLRTGYRAPTGWLAGGMLAWRRAGHPVATLPQLAVEELCERLPEFTVLDVRQPAEWAAGHIEGAVFLPGAHLPERADELRDSGPLAVVCASGFRATVAASLLMARGIGPVHNVVGGMGAWTAAGQPTVSS
jgi:hydroxyacylglutathione hydrolase